MATINEDYVSFEIAKLLKEKGFDVYGDGSIDSGIEIHKEYSPNGKLNDCSTSRPHDKAYPAPTQQMAMKWLREVHGVFIHIGNDDLDYWWQIEDVLNKDDNYDPICKSESYGGNKTYEEAVEAAIKYCLNLI